MPAKRLRIHLPKGMRQDAEAGRHNFINKIRAAAEGAGLTVDYAGDGWAERAASAAFPGYSLFHMHEPMFARTLTIRRAYMYPFWAIEKTGKRWEWDVAKEVFDPHSVNIDHAEEFVYGWRNRRFKDYAAERKGHILVPLQGKLLEHRSFQDMAPIAMLEKVIADHPARDIIATLHPKESYGAKETDALDALAAAHDRLRVEVGQADAYLRGAAEVVTMNSSVAFEGLFFDIPYTLHAYADFHHLSGAQPGVDAEFARYLHWFLQDHMINAGREDVEEKILAAFRRGGWDV
ncbi:MAG: hypothetical protein ACU0CI_15045 [Shimia sp.]